MDKQDQADWEFWKRVAKMFNVRLHGWSYRDHAEFIDPQMNVNGKAAAKLVEQEDEIIRLRALLLDTIDAAEDVAAMPIPEWAEARRKQVEDPDA